MTCSTMLIITARFIQDLGYKGEIGCQSFLYPTEEETRKIFIFMVEQLPKDVESDAGQKIESLLSKIAQENEANDTNAFSNANGIEVGGIRLPSAVDINSLPKGNISEIILYLIEIPDLIFYLALQKPSDFMLVT